MDWEGIKTAYLDRERARLGLPSRMQIEEMRAKRAQEAALQASQLETADVGRELTRAKIAALPEEQSLERRLREAQIRNYDEPNRVPPVERPITVAPGSVVLDPTTHQPLYTAPKPPADTAARDNARIDRSYQYNASKLESIGKPYRDQAIRLANLRTTVMQKTAQADSLIAPELLTVMAGGQGSGLRMNEAEIARIIGGRDNYERLKAAANKWVPGSGLSVTDAQRAQIQALLGEVSKRSQAHQNLISNAEDELVNADSVQEHRQIMAKLRRDLATADSALGTVNDTNPEANIGLTTETKASLDALFGGGR